MIFASEKRKEALLLLQDGAKEMELLLKSLNTTRPALLPQMRILEDHYLVSHHDDAYELTPLGNLLVDKISLIVSTADTIDADVDYWGTHKLDFIPPHLLERLGEIGRCKMVTPPVPETHEILRKFHENSKESGILYGINTFFHPNFKELFSDLIDNKVTIFFILSRDLLNNMRDFHNIRFNEFIDNSLFNFYLYPGDLGVMSLGLSDRYLMLTSVRSDESYDNIRLLCNKPGALKWGKELFEHYLKDSIPVTELKPLIGSTTVSTDKEE